MSAARARRRLMAFERYRRRALDLGAAAHTNRAMPEAQSGTHSKAYTRAFAKLSGWREPWTVPWPRCLAIVAGPFGPIRCGFPAGSRNLCRHCRRRTPP